VKTSSSNTLRGLLVHPAVGKGGDWAGPASIPDDQADAVERVWQSAQRRLAALSSKGRVVVAKAKVAGSNPKAG